MAHLQNNPPQLRKIIADLRNPLAPSALIALGDLGEAGAIDSVREGLKSRSDQIVIASTRAASKLVSLNPARADEIAAQLASLLSGVDASEPVRSAAFDSLLALKDLRLDSALAMAVVDARLENTRLLSRIEKLLRERKVKLTGP